VDSNSNEHVNGRAVAERWVLLIYTVPASPTSKRAAVWREIKRLGAMYLRDGVCVLPDTTDARAGLEALAARINALGGQSTLVRDAYLSTSTADDLRDELARERRAEYTEVAEATTGLQRYIREETSHHALDQAARASISGDIRRLRRWLEQVRARDYLHAGDATQTLALLTACSAELESDAVPQDSSGRRVRL